MLKLCITFDYEPWLDSVIDEELDHFFSITDDILDMLKEENVKTTFFVDTCSVISHKKAHQNQYVERFEAQVLRMVREEHDVELHLHPSWYRCVYDSNTNCWNMTYDGYSVQEYGFDEKSELCVQNIVKTNKAYLEALIRAVDPEYNCIAYRAGGFCIRPEKNICKILHENGIWIDSSVALEQYDAAGGRFDFRNMPNRINWWFDGKEGIGLVNKTGDSMYEVAIGYGKNNLTKYFGIPINKLRVNYQRRINNSGDDQNISNVNKFSAIKRHFFGKGILSFDTRGADVLARDIRENYRRYHCDKEDASVAIICHPKMASNDTIDNMRRFIRKTKCQKDDVAFCTILNVGLDA